MRFIDKDRFEKVKEAMWQSEGQIAFLRPNLVN